MRDYKTFKLADEPKLFGISILAAIPVMVLSIAGLLLGKAIPLMAVGLGFGVFMQLKFGLRGLRYFYSILYWSLPSVITRAFLPNSPDSSIREYRG